MDASEKKAAPVEEKKIAAKDEVAEDDADLQVPKWPHYADPTA